MTTATKAPKTKATKGIRIGDRVRFFTRSYIRGSRGPGRPARYTYHFFGEGVLLARNDMRAWTHHPEWTQEQVDAHLASYHVGLMNATGDSVPHSDLTQGNNPILLDRKLNGASVIWSYAEQVRPIKPAK